MNILDEANRLASKLANEFRKNIRIESDTTTPTDNLSAVVAYTGPFQLFYKKQFDVYEILVKKFGKDNVYITSDATTGRDKPLSFDDKTQIITTAFDINKSKIIKVKNLLVPQELLSKFDPNTTSFILVIPPEDVPVLQKNKYFHKYTDTVHRQPYKLAGYYITTPHRPLSADDTSPTDSKIIQLLTSPKIKSVAKDKLFRTMYGKSDKKLKDLFVKKMTSPTDDSEVEKTAAVGQVNKTAPDQTPSVDRDDAARDADTSNKVPPMKRMLVNPDTGKEIKVQSALKYPRWKPVYKKAERILKSAGIDRKNRVDEPEVNVRYKMRAKNKSNENWVATIDGILSEDIQNIIREWDVDEDTSSDTNTAPVAIYPGRFQPFHAGHYHAYQDLVKKFGKDNVYIVTSNKTNSENSPFNFNDKQNIITKMFDIDPSKVIQVKSPYQATELVDRLPKNTPLVWALGEKNIDRLSTSPRFKPYPDGPLTRFDPLGGYTYQVPQLQLNINGSTISGESVRDVFATGSPDAKKALFMRMYGRFDPQIFDLVVHRESSEHPSDNKPTSSSEEKPTHGSTLSGKSAEPVSKTHSVDMDILNTKIKNPETNNDILVKTALQYDKSKPVYKSAVKFIKSKKESVHRE